MDRYSLFTNDVECHSIWLNKLSDETGLRVLKEGMPLLLDIYSEYNIKTTFFFTGKIAEKFPEVVKMILPYGHEVGCHGYSHEVKDGFDILSQDRQVDHLKRAKDILEQISGEEIITFRAPALRVNKHTPEALIETGFKIDSSIPSQRFDLFFSFGSLKKMKWILAPRKPYFTKEKNLGRRGNSSLLEVPLSALFIPYIGTIMRISPFATAIIRTILKSESKINLKPIVFDIHPNEFLEEKTEDRKIERRSNNLFHYLVKDIIRSKLKARNLGKKAVPLFKKEIDSFLHSGFNFTSIKEYCYKIKLIQ
jgi:peptidoglycan/xylan/chitin deacetylase (PgdA/CDA1 family)